MTLQELRESSKEMLTTGDNAPILGSDRFTIHFTAEHYPEKIGFPFTFIGNRMKIPRIGFLRWIDGEKGDA